MATHKEILENCIKAQRKRIAVFRSKRNYWKGTAEQLFNCKVGNELSKYPNVDCANTKKELYERYGNKESYIEDIKNLFN